MSKRFQDKYRIFSIRLQNCDYSWNALYFVTINTHGHEEYFGEIENGNMYLSNIGTIADVLWYEIKNHVKVVELDAFVVMPNHIHGIFGINKPDNYLRNRKETGHGVRLMADALSIQKGIEGKNSADSNDNVKSRHALTQSQSKSIEKKTPGQKRQGNQGKNTLSSIIGSYKSAVTKHAHRLGYRFEWQSRFYDGIIRDELALIKARKYIENNISNWDKDAFYTR